MRFSDLFDRVFEQIYFFGSETAIVSIRLLQTIETIARRARRDEDLKTLRRYARGTHRASEPVFTVQWASKPSSAPLGTRCTRWSGILTRPPLLRRP